jgi:hypothetical protein
MAAFKLRRVLSFIEDNLTDLKSVTTNTARAKELVSWCKLVLYFQGLADSCDTRMLQFISQKPKILSLSASASWLFAAYSRGAEGSVKATAGAASAVAAKRGALTGSDRLCLKPPVAGARDEIRTLAGISKKQ